MVIKKTFLVLILALFSVSSFAARKDVANCGDSNVDKAHNEQTKQLSNKADQAEKQKDSEKVIPTE